MRQPTLCHYRLKVSSVHQLGFHLCRHCNHRLRVGWYTHQPSLIVECNTCSRRPPYESRSHFNVAPRNYGSSTAVEESSFLEKIQFHWELLQSMLGPPWTTTRSTKESTNIFLCHQEPNILAPFIQAAGQSGPIVAVL